MRFSFLPIIVLAMPILEIAGFIIVGKALGLWLTMGLIFLTSFLGLIILRTGGLSMVRDLQNASRTGAEPAKAMISGGMRVIAGILLFVPGFITDVIGLLLLVPAFRAFIWKAIGPRIVVAGSFKGTGFRPGPQSNGSSKVVDLDEDDFHRDGPKNSPWSPGKDGHDLPKP
ncbi:membrane protein FxsA [Agrobacterium vaccinii]|uniref:FxsA family protein n=1 Tax=Agrobacterium vaccinii TaxID=2735528 RepID=UPI000DD61E24|nr:FxsA family protein [Agrobacterium vaccinii]UHS57868.1 membrane protein FxsA [Agrobacterium vaccinii]UHS62650.1 membrane protein FxsA [Agrobacterium vaccinii]